MIERRVEPGKAPRKTVLVTGGAGYIGAPLVRRLLARGYRVRVVDSLLYGDEAIRGALGHSNLELVVADLSHVDVAFEAVAGVDAVIHLAAIVGDAACAHDAAFAVETNVDATRALVEASRAHGVSRLLFASTCSVYGASDDLLDEDSPLNPVSLYASTKVAAEAVVLAPRRAALAPVVLRFATAYGAAPRPRFDLVVNLLAAKAIVDGTITIEGGEQWRPFVHVDDIGRALILALEAPAPRVAGHVFNVGSNAQNRRLRELGELVRQAIPTAQVVTNHRVVDRRNYRVCFDKIRRSLGFRPSHDLADGIDQIKEVLARGTIDHRDCRFNNHRYLSEVYFGEHLLLAGD